MNVGREEPSSGQVNCEARVPFTDRMSYFYVLTGRQACEEDGGAAHVDTTAGLETSVLDAFWQLRGKFPDDVVVCVNPHHFYEVLTVFGITQLPAFGVTDFDLLESEYLQKVPRKLPSRWNLLKIRERRRRIRSRKLFVRAERGLLAHFADAVDSLLWFLTDLHVRNLKDGPVGVLRAMENKRDKLKGKKVVETAFELKKEIWG